MKTAFFNDFVIQDGTGVIVSSVSHSRDMAGILKELNSRGVLLSKTVIEDDGGRWRALPEPGLVFIPMGRVSHLQFVRYEALTSGEAQPAKPQQG